MIDEIKNYNSTYILNGYDTLLDFKNFFKNKFTKDERDSKILNYQYLYEHCRNKMSLCRNILRNQQEVPNFIDDYNTNRLNSGGTFTVLTLMYQDTHEWFTTLTDEQQITLILMGWEL